MGNPPFWWYLPGIRWDFHGRAVSFREGNHQYISWGLVVYCYQLIVMSHVTSAGPTGNLLSTSMAQVFFESGYDNLYWRIMSTSIPFCWQAMLDSKHHLYDKSWGMFSSEEWFLCFCLIIFWFYEVNFPKLITITRNKRLRRWFDNPLLHPGIFDGGSHDFSRAPWVVSKFLLPPKMTLNVSLFVDGSSWISLEFLQRSFQIQILFEFKISFQSLQNTTPHENWRIQPLGDWCEWKTWVCFTRLWGDRG